MADFCAYKEKAVRKTPIGGGYMKCPYCNESMVKGRTSLANGAAENNRDVYAYKCEKCKKVIIDYSSQDK